MSWLQVPSEVILASPSKHSTTGTFLWNFGFSTHFSHSVHEEIGDGFDYVILPRWSMSWRKLQLSHSTHCPLVSHCYQSPRILCTRCFVPWFLTTAFFSKFPFLIPKILISNVLLDTSVHHSFWSVINQVLNFFWWVSRSYKSIPVLSFSDSRILNLYNPSKISSGGIFVIDNKIPSQLRIEFLNIVISKNKSE